MGNLASQKRLRLSQVLALTALVLLVFSYVGGPYFEYRDPVTDEVEFDEENLSFQPFNFFLEEDEYEVIDVPNELKAHLGETLNAYFPSGAWSYLIGYQTMPIWKVSLEAPQYPKHSYPDGIPVFFTLTDFRGKVVEMNVINHYIGMDPMDLGGFFVRKLVPLVYLVFSLMIIVFLFYNGPGWWILGFAPALLPWYYLGFFSYWLYWFGHNLHDYGAFEVKPFMPTVMGDGKVAQFVTHSYPTSGFYVLFAVFVLLLLSVLIKRRALREASE
ncbi:MAG: cytochrome C [SAR324 cluster bacterium]|nr:cytochrome C [SAR324 cluster bacterium]MBL7035671.1 cytochrome C [SAR324 cluster bacterium]